MLLKSQELNLKTKDFFKGKIILLYGENQDLIKDINEQIILKFKDEEKIKKNISYFHKKSIFLLQETLLIETS